MRHALLLSIFIFFTWLLTFPPQVKAQTLNSESYTIRMGNFNMTSGLKSSASYSLTDTVGQLTAQFFAEQGYHVKAGLQYIYTLYDFSFTVSSLLMDLGTLIPGTFASATHTLTVTAPGQGYSVTIHALSPLKNDAGDVIPGIAPGVWTDPRVYGFGYRVTGSDVAADFLADSSFRPFPLLSAGESPELIMQSEEAGKNRTAEANYQVNVSPTQPPGKYSTQVIYLATPVY